MGDAVSDAAAWFDKADWIGVHTTPRTTLVISKLLDAAGTDKSHLMIDYDIPLWGGGKMRTKAVNWAKAFFVNSISPCNKDESSRAKLLEFLTQHQVPRGTENKYVNALAFFDHAVGLESKKKQTKFATGRNNAYA